MTNAPALSPNVIPETERISVRETVVLVLLLKVATLASVPLFTAPGTVPPTQFAVVVQLPSEPFPNHVPFAALAL